jgi:hypothetical protein
VLASPPEELLCPIVMELMVDPVRWRPRHPAPRPGRVSSLFIRCYSTSSSCMPATSPYRSTHSPPSPAQPSLTRWQVSTADGQCYERAAIERCARPTPARATRLRADIPLLLHNRTRFWLPCTARMPVGCRPALPACPSLLVFEQQEADLWRLQPQVAPHSWDFPAHWARAPISQSAAQHSPAQDVRRLAAETRTWRTVGGGGSGRAGAMQRNRGSEVLWAHCIR